MGKRKRLTLKQLNELLDDEDQAGYQELVGELFRARESEAVLGMRNKLLTKRLRAMQRALSSVAKGVREKKP